MCARPCRLGWAINWLKKHTFKKLITWDANGKTLQYFMHVHVNLGHYNLKNKNKKHVGHCTFLVWLWVKIMRDSRQPYYCIFLFRFWRLLIKKIKNKLKTKTALIKDKDNNNEGRCLVHMLLFINKHVEKKIASQSRSTYPQPHSWLPLLTKTIASIGIWYVACKQEDEEVHWRRYWTQSLVSENNSTYVMGLRHGATTLFII